MNYKTKEFLKSALYTFISGFLLVIMAQIDTLTIESIKAGAWVGILGAAVRSGLKALVALFATLQNPDLDIEVEK